jgi:hypothetical protein
MNGKIKQLTGTKKSEFDQFVKEQKIHLRSARLIPLINPGKEEALTSIFLSALTLIDEFRKDILSAVGMPTGGKLYVYTEVVFPDTKNLRVDGLILVVKGGVIKNAAILEMKNGSATLDKEQIGNYLQIAKAFEIPKMITVSNELVLEPTQSPLGTKKTPKGVELYHLSWHFIRTLARIRLFENDKNIQDEDQVRIMNEVVRYLENEKSGVGRGGFTQMKSGWKNVTEKVTNQATLRKTDDDLLETIDSWIQEERDLALKLSCELGDLVRTDARKYRGNIQARIDDDINAFLKTQTLSSTLSVQAAVSDITIRANFQYKTVEMLVDVTPPQDKTLRGQLGWIRGQVENRQLKKKLAEDQSAPSILTDLYVELGFRHARKPYRFPYGKLEDQVEECKGKEIKKVSIVHIKNFGRNFGSAKKFVVTMENMLPMFYKEIIQHLKNWVKPAPKILQKNIEEDSLEIADPEQRTYRAGSTEGHGGFPTS